MIHTPKAIARDLKMWRQGLIGLPVEFIDHHRRCAGHDLRNQGWKVLETTMVSDGWGDGMMVVNAVVRIDGGLRELQWHTSGAWFEKSREGGATREFEALQSTTDWAQSIE